MIVINLQLFVNIDLNNWHMNQGNYLKVLKNLHTEQLSKVQWKHQQECELLDDLRYYLW